MNPDHKKLLQEQDVEAWNAWRLKESSVKPDLHGADLHGADLHGADLHGADLHGADLHGANLHGANLIEANLSGANLAGVTLVEANLIKAKLGGANLAGANLSKATLSYATLTMATLTGATLTGTTLTAATLIWAKLGGATLTGAKLPSTNLAGATLSKANLVGANLAGANLAGASLAGANLAEANLQHTSLVNTDLSKANLTGCRVYGMSAWKLKLNKKTKQHRLIITQSDEPEITIDNIEVAQFVYLLLQNKKISDAIDTIGNKGVLLLGRFTEGRIAVLERLREELRKRDFLPLVFNFDKPETKTFTETVRLLAGMSRFVIADITNPKSTPLELQAVVPECMIPFATIIEEGKDPFAMFKDLWITYEKWVFPPISYSSEEELIKGLDKGIIDPAQKRFKKLVVERAKKMPVRRMREIIST